MSPDDVTTIFAILATIGVVVGVAGAIGAVLPGTGPRLREALAGQGVPLAWLVALVATLGSLYLSEVAHFMPCRLCWYQRIAMYPLVVVLGIGWLRRDAGARLTAAVLAGLGLAVNLWHLAIELWPSLEGGGCDPNNPCSLRWVEVWGFWTIPRMATVAFALVLLALALDRGPHPSQELLP
ncbi:MAG TPA: disulfide bond formation protein B [Iamia sp.]